jgi:hypothetical protein
MTTIVLLVMGWKVEGGGDAYAEIIATRPLGIVVYYCTPMDD